MHSLNNRTEIEAKSVVVLLARQGSSIIIIIIIITPEGISD